MTIRKPVNYIYQIYVYQKTLRFRTTMTGFSFVAFRILVQDAIDYDITWQEFRPFRLSILDSIEHDIRKSNSHNRGYEAVHQTF
uniref:Innexin n=1 Tax=Steinernema glaseri TaxID=37863 RepID=A0A1I7ZJ85_9BILA